MVLMKIRQNLTQDDLACRFCIDQSSVSRIINRWIPMLASVLAGLIVWPQTHKPTLLENVEHCGGEPEQAVNMHMNYIKRYSVYECRLCTTLTGRQKACR